MRVVVLCSSPYSETGCAATARLAQAGHSLVGALTLRAWDRATLLRKFGQWGPRESLRYVRAKLAPGKLESGKRVRNPYLESALRHNGKILRSLHQIGRAYNFPVSTCRDQNSARAIAILKQWAPDVAVFTGGNILREELLLHVSRLGVLNAHLASLPEIRGMSSPEWALLYGVPLAVTIHLIDSGIDTGPIVLRREFTDSAESLTDLRNHMIAFGIDLLLETIAGLENGTLSPTRQQNRDKDHQFFVIHDRLKAEASRRLRSRHFKPIADKVHG